MTHVTIMWLSYDHCVTIMWLVMWLSCDRHVTVLPGPWQGRGSPHHPWPVLAPPQGAWIADDGCGSVGERGREIPIMPSAVLQQKDTPIVGSCNYLKMWLVHNMHTRSTFDHVITYCKSEEVWCLMAVELSIERLCQEPIPELWTLKKRLTTSCEQCCYTQEEVSFACTHTKPSVSLKQPQNTPST